MYGIISPIIRLASLVDYSLLVPVDVALNYFYFLGWPSCRQVIHCKHLLAFNLTLRHVRYGLDLASQGDLFFFNTVLAGTLLVHVVLVRR